jgi:serine protease AprX
MAGHTLKRRLWRWAPGAFVLGFALSLALFGGKGYATPDNVHAAVYQWAAQHPGENVPIILSTTGGTAGADGAVSASGGTVEQNLDFISAVQATVPATAVGQLASSSDVAYISLDAPVQSLDGGFSQWLWGGFSLDRIVSAYPSAVKVGDAWSSGDYGQGVGVAVVDTGISPVTNADFTSANGVSRVVASVEVNSSTTSTNDGYGHGTHIAGIVGGDGDASNGKYVGIAPRANLVNVKISDDQGNSSMGSLLAGLQWIFTNRVQYNIKVVNLSLHSSIAESYKTSPIDAAVEFLWTHGIFVVVAAGNTGNAANAVFYPPSNDPYVMTTGAIDDKGTTYTGDDVPAAFSSYGVTQDGFTKPDLLAPGVGIVSDTDPNSILYQQGLSLGKVITPGPYLKLSGSSMAAGVMSGVAALVSQAHSDWTPGQLKCTLITKARKLYSTGTAYPANFAVPNAGSTVWLWGPSCNSDRGLTPSHGLTGVPIVPLVSAVAFVLSQPDPFAAAAAIGLDPVAANFVTTSPTDPTVALSIDTVDWAAIKWDAIKWDSIKWDAIKWDSIKWDSIKWDSIKWDSIKWDAIKWDSIKWDAIKWDSIKWDSIKWDSIKWDSIKWDSIKWDSVMWDAIKWDSIKWDAIKWDSIKWDSIKWDSIKWDAIKWDAIKWDSIKWDSIKWDSIGWDTIFDN